MQSLTDGVMNTRQASPIVVFDQQAVQFGQSLHRCARWAKGQCRADGSVQHPTGDRHDDTVTGLHVDKFAGGAALAIQPAQSSAVKRMPTVEDLDFLPDMGRMNRNWPSGGRTGCSPAAFARASGPRR